MSAISEKIHKQREYVVEIWRRWRVFFDNKMEDKNIIIEIYDSNSEITIYVYEAIPE
jgi:hypothetical protein